MSQIRERYIQQAVLNFYKDMPTNMLQLPFDILRAVSWIPKSLIFSYREFASMHNITVETVSRYAESEDGVTHYDKCSGGHIILYNDNKPRGRQRFTVGHEVGHVLLKHLLILSISTAAQNNFYGISDIVIEQEADLFSGIVLCPFPVLKNIGVNSPSQIQKICDISTQASLIKYEQYIEWSRYHRKTAWENDITKLFSKYIQDQATQAEQSPKLIATASLI